MKKVKVAVFLFIALACASPVFAKVPDEIIERVQMSVVAIYCGNGFLGTGYMINARGDILTNYHVCSDDPKIVIKLYDGRTFEAQRIFLWKSKDIALLGFSPTSSSNNTSFPYLSFNDTTWIAPGAEVAAIGHSKYGLWQVIQGKVKSKDYFLKYQPTLLFGFSGSPLINEKGYVVGLNASSDNRDASITQEGFYSYAITLNDIQEFLDYFYGRKTMQPITQSKPSSGQELFTIDVFATKCVWVKTQEGKWCRFE